MGNEELEKVWDEEELEKAWSEELGNKIDEFEAKLKPFTSEVMAVLKANSVKKKADEVAKQAKWGEIQKSKGKKILEGRAASSGMVAGVVRNVHQHVLKLMAKIQPGEVVIGEWFEPKHELLLKKAAALVTDSGGKTAPAAMIAQTLGIPAVVGTIEASYILEDGQMVVVDGTEGAVYAYKEKAASKRSGHQGD